MTDWRAELRATIPDEPGPPRAPAGKGGGDGGEAMSEFDYTAHPYGVKAIGPFVEEHRLTVLDYRVPYISAIPQSDGSWSLCLDERFVIDCSDDEMRKWIPFVADAMAVAAGYSCHGENSGPINPFKNRLVGLTGIETEDS